MLQVGSLILNLLLLLLKIPLDLSTDISHKGSGFSKTLVKKNLEFVLNKGPVTVTFKLDFVLLPVEVDFVLEK